MRSIFAKLEDFYIPHLRNALNINRIYFDIAKHMESESRWFADHAPFEAFEKMIRNNLNTPSSSHNKRQRTYSSSLLRKHWLGGYGGGLVVSWMILAALCSEMWVSPLLSSFRILALGNQNPSLSEVRARDDSRKGAVENNKFLSLILKLCFLATGIRWIISPHATYTVLIQTLNIATYVSAEKPSLENLFSISWLF
jgi:hypothetical protein